MAIGLAKTDIPHDPKHERRIYAMATKAGEDAKVRCAYKEYITSKAIYSDRASRKKIRRMLENIARHSEERYNSNKELMRPVGEGVWELKPGAHRLLMFRHEDRWIITDAFKKPSKNVQDEKIKAAQEDRARLKPLLEKQ